jgi:hypothetical protein
MCCENMIGWWHVVGSTWQAHSNFNLLSQPVFFIQYFLDQSQQNKPTKGGFQMHPLLMVVRFTTNTTIKMKIQFWNYITDLESGLSMSNKGYQFVYKVSHKDLGLQI